MKKVFPVLVCICGLICVIGSIGGIFWELPKFVYLLMAIGHLTLAAATLHRSYRVNGARRE